LEILVLAVRRIAFAKSQFWNLNDRQIVYTSQGYPANKSPVSVAIRFIQEASSISAITFRKLHRILRVTVEMSNNSAPKNQPV